MSRLDDAHHEIACHGNGSAAGLLVHASITGKSGKGLLDSAQAYVDCGLVEAGQIGAFALSMDDREAARWAMSACALAPAIAADESLAKAALLTGDVSKLFTEECSSLDIDCYRDHPIPLEHVIQCGLAASYMHQALGEKGDRFLEAVDYAFRQTDNLLPLSAFTDYDRIKKYLEIARSTMKRWRDDNDPVVQARREDARLKRSWEAKQRNYEQSTGRERDIRDRMRRRQGL